MTINEPQHETSMSVKMGTMNVNQTGNQQCQLQWETMNVKKNGIKNVNKMGTKNLHHNMNQEYLYKQEPRIFVKNGNQQYLQKMIPTKSESKHGNQQCQSKWEPRIRILESVTQESYNMQIKTRCQE